MAPQGAFFVKTMKPRFVLPFLFLLAAGALRPPERPLEAEDPVFGAGLLSALLLQREFAAADVAWVALVQSLGSNQEERRGYPMVPRRVDIVTTLDPHFALAYQVGVFALVSDPGKSEAMARILERGRVARPLDPDLPRLLGFIEHFGRIDLPKAAAYYRESARLGGPPLLDALATRLENSALNCRQMFAQLQDMQKGSTSEEEVRLLARQMRPVVENCEKVRLTAAAVNFRLTNKNREPTDIAELLATGVEAPAKLPGLCWQLRSGTPYLVECP